ncbi:unnamed protein product, partial [Effrenium voratum]
MARGDGDALQRLSKEQDPAATDPATTESQQLLDSVREGFAARGAGWLREELAKQTAVQLRQLAGTAGVQQYEAGRNASKKVAQHVSEEQDTAGRASADDALPQMACGSWQRRWATGRPSLRARLRGVPLRNAEPCLQGLAMELGVPFENITRDTLVHRIVMALCPLAAPGAQADIKYHVWRLLRKLRDARAETAEAVAAAARDIVESSNLCRAAAAYCLDVTVEVIARRHCSAAEEARILVTRVVSALQQWPAVEAALASQVAVTWEDAVASLQGVATPGLCVPLQHALLAAVLDARGDQRAGWWRLADCQERADPVDVASRLCFLAELDEEPPAADTDGDVLEAVLCMLKHKYRSRKFDEGNTALLRALMRRYGWDRRSEQGGTCRWSQTFKDVRKSEDWSAFAWFLAVELLHPLASIGVRDLHSPIAVAEARGGEDGIDTDVRQLRDDLIAWQAVEGCSRIPSSEEHPQLAKRVERHQTSGASARLKALALKKAYPRSLALRSGAGIGLRHPACAATIPCFVACAATMNAFGLAMEQGDLQEKVEVALHAAWLVSVLGDPVYTPCKHCGTKIDGLTSKCKRADSNNCQTEASDAPRVLATVHIADWSGQLDNVLVGGEELAVLARVDGEAALARAIQDKGAHVLCFKGPFDLRLGTSPRLAKPRRRALGGYSDGVRPMVKKVTRLLNQKRDGAVLPVQNLYQDISCSDMGSFFLRGEVFANYVTLLAVAEDDPAIDEIDVAGDRHLVTKHEKVHPYPRKDGACSRERPACPPSRRSEGAAGVLQSPGPQLLASVPLRLAASATKEALLDGATAPSQPAAVTPPHVLLPPDDLHPRSEPDDCCVCLEPLRPDGHHAARPAPLPVCPRHVLHLGCLAQLRVQARRPSDVACPLCHHGACPVCVAGGWSPEHDDQLTAWCREAGLHPPSRLPDRRTDQASVAGQDAPEPQAPAHVVVNCCRRLAAVRAGPWQSDPDFIELAHRAAPWRPAYRCLAGCGLLRRLIATPTRSGSRQRLPRPRLARLPSGAALPRAKRLRLAAVGAIVRRRLRRSQSTCPNTRRRRRTDRTLPGETALPRLRLADAVAVPAARMALPRGLVLPRRVPMGTTPTVDAEPGASEGKASSAAARQAAHPLPR